MALKIFYFQDSDADKSDDNLVVDVSNEVSTFLSNFILRVICEKKGFL